MNEQITERSSTPETDIAVIKSNYVRRDEFFALREEVGIGCAKVNAKIDLVRADLNGKMDVSFAQVNAPIDRTTTTVLKWVFASQISVAAMLIAAIKYL